MGTIKVIYDVAKDGTILKTKISSIKRALKTESKLNVKFLDDIQTSKKIEDKRRKKIIGMLEVFELSDAIKFEIPYKLICNKKFGCELAETLKIKRIQSYDFERLIEELYLMINYLKKDCGNKSLHLNLRLININKYNKALLSLLN